MSKSLDKTVTVISILSYLINSVQVGEEITRTEIHNAVGDSLPKISPDTIDSNRNYFSQAGYIKTIRRGVYVKIKKVPMNMTTLILLSEAYPEIYGKTNSEFVFEKNDNISFRYRNTNLIFSHSIPKSNSVVEHHKSTCRLLGRNIFVSDICYDLYIIDGNHVLLPTDDSGQIKFILILKENK